MPRKENIPIDSVLVVFPPKIPVVIGCVTAGPEMAKESTEFKGRVGEPVFLDRQGDIKRRPAGRKLEACEAFAKTAWTGKDVNDWNWTVKIHRCGTITDIR
jgi:hypothetical protein